MSIRIYVGSKSGGLEVFRASKPTPKSHGHVYRYVIGPFRTLAAARLMAKYGGHGNPHLQTVSDAEKLVKQGYE